jgi:hypothetical protein
MAEIWTFSKSWNGTPDEALRWCGLSVNCG